MSNPTSSALRRIGRPLLLIVGAGMSIVALALAIHTSLFLRNGARTQATVIALVPKTDPDEGNVDYYPQFSFQTPDGRSFSVASQTGSNPPGFREGQQVSVIYSPANPVDAKIDSFVQLWFLPLVFFFVGAMCLGVLRLNIYLEKRRNRKLASR
jgi:hypothetical protein